MEERLLHNATLRLANALDIFGTKKAHPYQQIFFNIKKEGKIYGGYLLREYNNYEDLYYGLEEGIIYVYDNIIKDNNYFKGKLRIRLANFMDPILDEIYNEVNSGWTFFFKDENDNIIGPYKTNSATNYKDMHKWISENKIYIISRNKIFLPNN